MKLEQLVTQATEGNKDALEQVVKAIEDNIYALALRMLVSHEDAKDATQEILVKVITNLSAFRFESQFTTWVYRIAANFLISEKRLRDKDPKLTFDLFKQDLESELQVPDDWQDSAEHQILLNELRISCTMAMLLCLSPLSRMAYILGELLEMEHRQASEILSVPPANYRKMLSRARTKIIEFMSSNCGLANASATCHCEKKLHNAMNRGCVNREQIIFSTNAQYSYSEVKKSLVNTQQELKALALQKSIINENSPIELSTMIEALVCEGINANKAIQRVN